MTDTVIAARATRRHRSAYAPVAGAQAPAAGGVVRRSPPRPCSSIFFTYPLLSSLWQSFFATSGGVSTWVGLEQYARLFKDPLVAKSLG